MLVCFLKGMFPSEAGATGGALHGWRPLVLYVVFISLFFMEGGGNIRS